MEINFLTLVFSQPVEDQRDQWMVDNNRARRRLGRMQRRLAARPAQPTGSAPISVSVRDGVVSVNGEEVGRAPRHGASVQASGGTIHVNGEVVWPPRSDSLSASGRRDRAWLTHRLPTAPPTDGLVRNHSLAEVALRNSLASTCTVKSQEPCPLCLDHVTVGQEMRTLPCFHFLHKHCAEKFFWEGHHVDAVCCPMCRLPVNVEQGNVSD